MEAILVLLSKICGASVPNNVCLLTVETVDS